MKKRGLAALATLDVAFLCGMALMGVAFLYDSRRINAMAAALPRYTSILMIGLILYVLYGKVREACKSAESKPEAGAAESGTPTREAVAVEMPTAPGRQLHWFVTWVLIATYPFLVLQVGFGFACLLFLTAVSIIMGTKPLTGMIYGIVGTIALVVLFIFILKVPMPDSTLSELFPALMGY